MNRLVFGLLLALLARPNAWAQAPATDVILRTDGQEVPGRVLTITPREVRYLPPAGADTLRLAAAEVFLIRYANGTREVLHPAGRPAATNEPLDLLASLTDAQRAALGRQAAARCYNDHTPFWGALGATLYGGPLLGAVAPAVIAPHVVRAANLRAPQPALLAAPAYGTAYRSEAQRRKRARTWAGYGVGAGAWVLLIGALAGGG